MYDIADVSQALQDARLKSNLTQRELAERVGTSQSAIASLERGATNPTVETLARCANAAGFVLRVTLEPLIPPDPVIERYKRDVDRTLLRENLRKSVDERLRTLSEWWDASRELQRATGLAKQAARKSPVRAR